jgi:hypothetical protein
MLSKQVVSFNTSNGVDTKTAPKLVDGSKFLQLQNAVFDKGSAGQLHKRNGYNLISPVDTNGNAITNGEALGVFNEELDLLANGSFYAKSPTANAFVPKGTALGLDVSERSISGNAYNQANQDGASQSGVSVFAWEDGRGGVWCTVIDEVDGTIFVPQVQLYATGSCPKVISNGTLIYILCSDTIGLIHRFTVNPGLPTANPTVSGTILPLIAIPGALFEVAIVNGVFFLASQNSGGFSVSTFSLAGFSLLSGVSESTSTVTSFAVCALTGGAAFLAVAVVGGITVYFFNGASLITSKTVTTASSSIPLMTVAGLGTTLGQLWYQQEPIAGVSDRYVNSLQVSATTGAGTQTTVARGVGLASQVFAVSGVAYFLVVYPSASQQTYFLLTSAGVVVGKFYVLNAGPFSTHSRLPVAQLLSAGNYSLAVASQNFLEVVNAAPVSVNGVAELMLGFGAPSFSTAQLGGDLHLATGAMLLAYDGAVLTEASTNVYPEPPIIPRLYSTIQVTPIQLSNDSGQYQIFSITFAQASTLVPGEGLTDGQLIDPGEYITFSANIGGSAGGERGYLYYVVNGVGSDPAFGGGWTAHAVNINSTDTAATIATKTLTVLQTISFPDYATSISQPGTIYMVANNPVDISQPATSRQFVVSTTYYGSVSTNAVVQINCCPGNLIQPGQYVTLGSVGFSNAGFYFLVDSIGAQTLASLLYSPINILSTDSAATVASKLASQFGGVSVGNQVTITAVNVGLIAASAISTVASVETYSYVAVYEQVDAQGQLMQSAPSLPTTVQLPPFSGAYIPPTTISVSTTMLRLTQRTGVDIVFYRTIGNGTIFYRDTSPLNLLLNNPAVDYSPTYFDTTSDLLLQASQTLYTEGGVVSNDSPPAFSQIVSNADRLWGLSSESPNLWWFSQPFLTGLAVAWSEAQTMRVNPSGGAIVGGASMDGNFITLEESQIWVISGDGPDVTGNGAFSGPTLVSSAGGCRDIGSLALMPDGLMYKDETGFWLLDRSFQVHQIGRDVWAYNADIVSSATMVVDATQIRFLSVAGTTLVYDYVEKQWGTFTNHQGVSSAIYEGTYYYLRAAGSVMQENPGSYVDGTVGYPMFAQTAWLKFSGNLQGYERIWKAYFLGFFPGTNPIQIQTAYNDVATIVDTEIWNSQAGTGTPVWGADPVWGASVLWGGVGASVGQPDVVQFRYDPSKQLCESIQFTIQDLPPFPTSETWGLDGIDLEVGIRKGGFKIQTNQRIG